jgi:hypothetical protein
MTTDRTMITCGGDAKPTDLHLLSTVVAVDGGIHRVIERRMKRRRGSYLGTLRDVSTHHAPTVEVGE